MKRFEGIHFYINIDNFNDIILDELDRYHTVNHSIHALDTFFSSIESYGKRNYKGSFFVEKITGSRLHLYIVDEICAAFNAIKAISCFAYGLTKVINKEISKYKNLLDFDIQIGAAYGEFYDFEFTDGDYSEETTIGYAANFAAKLQSKTKIGCLSISEDIYQELLDKDQGVFKKILDPSFMKYGQSCYYTTLLSLIHSPIRITDMDVEAIIDYSNRTNLNDIKFESIKETIDFSLLNKTICKKINGIPVFADVRGFTTQFDPDDKNLNEMARRTKEVLSSMYSVTKQCGGIHVQFQGDRELSLYPDISENTGNSCFKRAVLSAMRMIDLIKPLSLHIGVGEDYGQIFATRIGARGEKDNILLGKTIIEADLIEDQYADEDQLVISKTIFEVLQVEDHSLSQRFKLMDCGLYVTTTGYREYLNYKETKRLQTNTQQNKYNGAWG